MLDVNKLNHLLQDKVKQLQKQLKQAHLVIKLLRQQNQTLKQKLTRYENQQSTYCLHSQGSQQIFTESSQSEQEQNQSDFINIREQQCGEIQSSRNRTNKKQRNQSPELAVMTPLSNKIIEKTPPKIIFNYQSQGYHVPKVLQKQSKKQSYKQGSQSYYQKNIKKRELSVQNSAIKNQSPIVIKNMTNTLFQRIKNSNKIYDAFFVTGYSFHSMNSQVQYCFPAENRHFSVILSLIYTQNSLRPLENTQGKNQKYNPKQGGLTIKDSLVMILCKNENGQKQYLFACQIDDIIEGPDHNLYVFNRIFGFITSCNFFSAYMKIVQNFITKINNYRQEQIKTLSSLNQYTTKEQLTTLIQQHLKFLYQKNVNQNQSLTLSLGKQISIFIDVPSTMQAYKSLLQYRPWGILFSPVYFSYEQQIKQKQLFGFLLIYMLTQTKIMVYSMVKSKVSQAILHALQMIKPLQYVNPIIMATIKDQHQQYFNAPMSVILGLWGQAKQKRKQKIQIFMNKKPSFSTMSGIIQQNRMSNIDGVIFNLDTGYTFGGGISHQKNKLAIQLNYLIQNKCKSTKEQYKLIQNLIKGRIYLEMPQMREISDKIIKMINHTQLYTFYKQKNDGIFKM